MKTWVIDRVVDDVNATKGQRLIMEERKEFASFREASSAWNDEPPSNEGEHKFLGRKADNGITTLDCK